jgi:hypothetical protein
MTPTTVTAVTIAVTTPFSPAASKSPLSAARYVSNPPFAIA